MKTQLLLLTLALAPALRAGPPGAAALAAGAERAIERAYLRASTGDLAAAVPPLAAALAADPNNPALLYERAFAHYAALPALRPKNDKPAMIAELEQAIALLERVKGQPWEAEAAALHGGILGQLIGFKGGMAGMTLGPKSASLLARADEALPGNPRVLLFRGISLINTPPAFGGDPAKGAQLLQQALDAFGKSDAAAPGPQWGRADALTWLGIAKQKAGDAAAARTAWEQALALEPDYAWVKFALLPALDQKKAK
jgi:tetratricopeptide (TPR) repeat protein